MTDRLDGNRLIPFDRESVGRFVREAWVRWAKTQPSPKPSWLLPYDELDEQDKEADRQIGEAVARWTLIHDASQMSIEVDRLVEAASRAHVWLSILSGAGANMPRDKAKELYETIRMLYESLEAVDPDRPEYDPR